MRTPEEIYDRILRAARTEGIHEAWKEYRRSVTDYLIAHAEKGSTLLILGAGRMGDLDLPKLMTHFGSVTLADIDREAMEEGLAYWKLSAEGTDPYGNDILRIREVDLTGITREHYIEWIRLILEGYEKHLPGEEFASSLEHYLKRVYQETFHHDPGLGFCRYDHAAILGVHSQLNNMFAYLWLTLSDLLGNGKEPENDFEMVTDRIFSLIRSHTGNLTDRISKAVQDCASEGAFVGLEMERIGVPGPVDGAAQAFSGYAAMHIEGEAEICDPVDLIWDYDPGRNKSYRMRLMLCK